jgi:polysaccharide biosynthesis protein PslJ
VATTLTVLPARALPTGKDATNLLCVYVLVLCFMPAKLVLQGIPLDLGLTMLFGLTLGILWFCAHQVADLGMAKGFNVVRTGMFCYVLSQLATYGAATYNWLPYDELKATDRTLLTLMAAISVGLMVCDGVRSVAGVERILKAVVAGVSFVSLVGVLQSRLGFDLTTYLTLPGLRSVAQELTILERSIFLRPSGTAGHPIEYGVVCSFALPLALHFGFAARRLGDRSQWRWWLCFSLIAAGIMFSLSRSAILGAGLAGLVLFATWPWRRRFRMMLLGVVFLGAMRLLIPGLVGTLYALFSNFGQDNSVKGRLVDYGPAGQEISRYPLLGHGVGTFLPEKYGWLDNQYLMTLVNNGFLGLAALAAVLVTGVYAALRVRHLTKDPDLRNLAVTLVACLAVPTIAAATFDMLAYAMITGLTFLTIGAAGALLRHVTAEKVREVSPF